MRDDGPGADDPGVESGPAGANIHVVRIAPAKLNLTLAVLGRRDDGYHSLHSVMVPLSLGDALTVSTPHGARHDSLRVSGLPLDANQDNLVLRAIAATRAALEKTRPASPNPSWLAARLAKRIPVAAGLGGGSSDAAAAIEASLAAWHAAMSASDKAEIAASLGSDVPFFLARANALVTGRGEFVAPLPEIAGEPPAVLLVTPHLALSTPAVFAAYAAGARARDHDRARQVSERLAANLMTGLTSTALIDRATELAAANDLLPAALVVAPELEPFMLALQRLLGRPVCQSGSGPTQWVLYPTLTDARRAARTVRQGVADRSLPQVGDGEPFVAATVIVPPHAPPKAEPPGPGPRTYRPRTVHNERKDEPHNSKGDTIK